MRLNDEAERRKFNLIKTNIKKRGHQNDKYNNCSYYESYSFSSKKDNKLSSILIFPQSGEFIIQDSLNNSAYNPIKKGIFTYQKFQRGNSPQQDSRNDYIGTVSNNRKNGTIPRNTNAEMTSKNRKNIKQVPNNRNYTLKEERKINTKPSSRKSTTPQKSDNNNLIHKYRNNNNKQKDKNIFIQPEEKTKNINIGKELTKPLK